MFIVLKPTFGTVWGNIKNILKLTIASTAVKPLNPVSVVKPQQSLDSAMCKMTHNARDESVSNTQWVLQLIVKPENGEKLHILTQYLYLSFWLVRSVS